MEFKKNKSKKFVLFGLILLFCCMGVFGMNNEGMAQGPFDEYCHVGSGECKTGSDWCSESSLCPCFFGNLCLVRVPSVGYEYDINCDAGCNFVSAVKATSCVDNCADYNCKKSGLGSGICDGPDSMYCFPNCVAGGAASANVCSTSNHAYCSSNTIEGYRCDGTDCITDITYTNTGDTYCANINAGEPNCKCATKETCDPCDDLAPGQTCFSTGCGAAATHKECSPGAGTCIDIAGGGIDLCGGDDQCKYKKCVGALCNSVNVEGNSPKADVCNVPADCAAATHKECSPGAGTCIDIAGGGIDLCGGDDQCKYKKCVGALCNSVNVEGNSPKADVCNVPADCAGPPPTCDVSAGLGHECDDTHPCPNAGDLCSTSCVCVSSGGGSTVWPVTFTNPLDAESFEELIANVINWLLAIVGSIVLLFIIIAGIMYMTAAGDEAQLTRAKKMLFYTILGFAIILISYSLIKEIKDILGIVS